jgi:hypothetical protein
MRPVRPLPQCMTSIALAEAGGIEGIELSAFLDGNGARVDFNDVLDADEGDGAWVKTPIVP